MAERSEIASWYDGRSVFITGASGFMGKVLLEKLLYSCPGIKTVYILLRSKRGRTALQRIEDMWKLPMFHRLRTLHPNAIKKVVPIEGDLVSDCLGIKISDRKLLIEEVSVVFHLAATLKLEGTLKDAIEMNTNGTLKILQLCKEMKDLKAMVHLSTAFCNCDIHQMGEKVYNWKHDPHEVIRTVQWMPNEALINATTEIIAPHPNTYTYSKRLSELLVLKEFPNLLIAITRPSIVSPSTMEPVAGWVDNLNGPIGLLVGAGKGVIRSMQCKPQYNVHMVPVDFAINGLIAVGYNIGSAIKKPKEIPVYNMTQDAIVKVTFGEILDTGRAIVLDNPFEGAVWYPGGDMRATKLLHNIYVIFFHFLPAYFIDFLMLIFRQKRFMVRLQWRIQQGLELLQFFTTRQFLFDSANFLSLWEEMNDEDKQRFCIDFKVVDVDTYLKTSILGARQYCMKEDLSSIPRCRIKQKFLYVLDKLVVFSFYYFILSTFASFFEPLRYVLDSVVDYVKTPFIGTVPH